MKLKIVDSELVVMRVRDLTRRPAVMLRAVGTRGGKRIEAGARVMVEGYTRYVSIETGPCEHCGVSFSLRLDAAEAVTYVALLEAPGSKT